MLFITMTYCMVEIFKIEFGSRRDIRTSLSKVEGWLFVGVKLDVVGHYQCMETIDAI